MIGVIAETWLFFHSSGKTLNDIPTDWYQECKYMH